MSGFDRPWWLVGGWSIEAFTGARREHEDVDVAILACDVPALRAHLGTDWTPWSNDGGTFRPLNDQFPDAFHDESQIWLRRDSESPWVVDFLVTPERDGQWVNKRWAEHAVPLEQATWVAEDGIRYLNPEITLHFKAKHCRPKDERDLEVSPGRLLVRGSPAGVAAGWALLRRATGARACSGCKRLAPYA